MRIEDIEEAEEEAIRFLKRIQEFRVGLENYKKEILEDPYYDEEHPRDPVRSFLYGNRYTGAVRRASMDLTMALAKMRRRG